MIEMPSGTSDEAHDTPGVAGYLAMTASLNVD